MSRIHVQSFILALPLTLFVQNIHALNQDILRFLFFNNEEYPPMGRCLHVLDLFRKALLDTHNQPRDEAPESTNQGEGKARSKLRVGHDVVRPATELHEAGIRFKKSEGKCLLAIDFDEVGGELKLPNFVVNDHTESRFLNLIAFERCHIPAISDITSFIAFMNCIIDDGRDIKLLSSKGIINNILGTDKEAADLFNTMSKDLVLWNDPLFDVYQKLVDYSKKTWPKHRANLSQTYFTNPWAIISVVAAFILFSLTLLQTIFTIRN
ncbi:UPF0481 protein At3g47200-like [Diospyros lotus]|uniref:UPF0481 protein At3g47200-like n=1 Tax=Diospyros lotus TaxID=55363 RepID=UPI002257BE4A|nr:UPF0481 protein At3g47200-like [Diospyros lotus]